MKRVSLFKCPSLWFLLPASLATIIFALYLAVITPTGAQSAVGHTPIYTAHPIPDDLILARDETGKMDTYSLTYRGMDAGSLVLDITLLDPNPAYVYRRKISKELAQSGFWLAHHRYLLISASRYELKLVRLKS